MLGRGELIFMEPIIFHVDVNSAFLSWEAVHRMNYLGVQTDLREELSAVGGDTAMRHGIILAKSIPAKKYGIQTGDSILKARQKCPGLLVVPPHYDLYERCSKALMQILKEYTPCVEQYSIDEAYMDMSGTKWLWGTPKEAAQQVRGKILKELGFTVNIGVSTNKVLAKMASDFKKPNRVHTLFPGEIENKMWSLPVGRLFFVGRATEQKLHSFGISTIGQLARTDPAFLKKTLKKHGEIIWAFANGRDADPVQAVPEPQKGYGNSTTIAFDVRDVPTAKLVLLALAETVGMRLRQAKVQAEVIAVGIKTYDFRYYGHQMTLSSATDITEEIYKYAVEIFMQMWDGTPIRHLGVYTGKIREALDMRQIDMFDRTDYGKLKMWNLAVDSVRKRYGPDALRRGVFVNHPLNIDHMSGGISREKRTVDYEAEQKESERKW